MTIKEVHYIYTICRERSFSKAAARLYMSQPALSTIVRRVERELGVRIFDRSTIPLTLTESGRIFIEAAQKIGDVDSDMMNRLQDIKMQQSGTCPSEVLHFSAVMFCRKRSENSGSCIRGSGSTFTNRILIF